LTRLRKGAQAQKEEERGLVIRISRRLIGRVRNRDGVRRREERSSA